jgi:hypothetical protein
MEDQMGWACSEQGSDNKRHRNFGQETLMEETL